MESDFERHPTPEEQARFHMEPFPSASGRTFYRVPDEYWLSCEEYFDADADDRLGDWTPEDMREGHLPR